MRDKIPAMVFDKALTVEEKISHHAQYNEEQASFHPMTTSN
jgi:hypothetical protein